MSIPVTPERSCREATKFEIADSAIPVRWDKPGACWVVDIERIDGRWVVIREP